MILARLVGMSGGFAAARWALHANNSPSNTSVMLMHSTQKASLRIRSLFMVEL